MVSYPRGCVCNKVNVVKDLTSIPLLQALVQLIQHQTLVLLSLMTPA